MGSLARVAAIGLLLACGAAAGEEEAVPVRRHVLALVAGKGPSEHNDEDIVHNLVEMPVNHLGFVVDRHYIDRGPPPAPLLDRARAVLLYLDGGKPQEWLWPWLEETVAKRDVRVVHFGGWGPLEADPARLARWLARFGLEYDDGFVGDSLSVTVTLHAGEACRYEDDPQRFAEHHGPRNLSADNEVWVETEVQGDAARHPVVTGPWGGLALNPWTIRLGESTRRWHLDPFRFFRDALGARRVPAPHPAVLNGRRMWFSQTDGDGFESLSTVRSGEFSARIMHEQVFTKYDLPFTVSIIVRGLTRDYDVKEPTPAMELAKEILSRSNIEPASHGVLHTLEWQRTLDEATKQRAIMSYPALKNYEYSPVAEVRDSIRFINERLLDGKRKCRVMLWTGECNPFEDTIEAAVKANCFNLNGGVFRWDTWHDSVAFVTPWSRRVGKQLQVYAGAANENDFDGFFTTMPGSFAHIDQTIERTGAPHILKPADLYMHFYSAERPARLRSIHKLIKRWALKEPTAPVFASTYCAAVHDAVTSAKIDRTPTGWRFRDFGGCRTVRIDGEERGVDWTGTKGILGFKRDGASLYLHLARPDAEVALADAPATRPHVREANCLLEDVVLGPRGVAVTARAHNKRIVVFAGLPRETRVTATIDGKRESRVTNHEGRLVVALPTPGTSKIDVQLLR